MRTLKNHSEIKKDSDWFNGPWDKISLVGSKTIPFSSFLNLAKIISVGSLKSPQITKAFVEFSQALFTVHSANQSVGRSLGRSSVFYLASELKNEFLSWNYA